jgi:hypothetical protein
MGFFAFLEVNRRQTRSSLYQEYPRYRHGRSCPRYMAFFSLSQLIDIRQHQSYKLKYGGFNMSLALTILLNILIFSAATFGTSLIIEKYYRGRLKWIIVPAFTLFSAILIMK